ncbi:unnamed protein product [Brachionus calyciflorus]|uniref:C2 tensin-type domain-containing protein n=1 Tax=Brachionus calyciflorus TaxID=104777 RepID=A0A813PJS8_9BILA|nr:unnamed protein product [Brachionus calyciflorus]
MLRQKVIDYYDDLKNQVDIKFEKLLINENKFDLIEKINTKRTNIIDKIQQILHLNLEYLNSNKHVELNDYFRPLFCFLLDEKYNQSYHLIVLDHFFENNDEKIQVFQINKNILLRKVIKEFIELKKTDIIDLSKHANNIIPHLKLEIDQHVKTNDFRVIETLINTQYLHSITLHTYFATTIQNNFFEFLPCLKKLEIYCGDMHRFDTGCFNGSKIEDLSIHSREMILKFDHNLLNELTNLKQLKLSLIDVINFNSEMHKLKHLKFNFCTLDPNSNLNNLKQLESLTLRSSGLFNFNHSIFSNFKQLKYLNLFKSELNCLEIEWLNELEQLEYLNLCDANVDKFNLNYECLNLSKLKYLAFNSHHIPNLVHLKKLEFLKIKKLQIFNGHNLENQNNLKGLNLNLCYDQFNKIKIEDFNSSSYLAYLEFNVNTGIEERINFDKFIQSFKELNNNIDNNVFVKVTGCRLVISQYEKIEDFIHNEMNFSPNVNEIVNEYQQILID